MPQLVGHLPPEAIDIPTDMCEAILPLKSLKGSLKCELCDG